MADIQEFDVAVALGGVTLVTTAETVVVTLPRLVLPTGTARVVVLGYAQVNSGANATGVRYRIRRGTTAGGTLIGDASLITVAGAQNVAAYPAVLDEVSNVSTVQYVLTCEQLTATADGAAYGCSIIGLLL